MPQLLLLLLLPPLLVLPVLQLLVLLVLLVVVLLLRQLPLVLGGASDMLMPVVRGGLRKRVDAWESSASPKGTAQQ